MTAITSLLVPLDGSRAAARSLGCATWLATHLHAKLHILSATAQPLSPRDEIIRLHVPEACWNLIILHQAPKRAEDAILAAAAEHDADLIIMSAQGETADRKQGPEDPNLSELFAEVGHVARAVIEQSGVPVLLLPRGYRESLPWRHVLVPLSGEVASDQALRLAVTLANALKLHVHVIHVLDSPAGRGLAATAHYADAPHHEFPQQLAELVRRTIPHCTAEERRCITDVELARGDIATQLLQQLETKHAGLLVVGWHGRFIAGHAEVLKSILKAVSCPVLLVKAARRAPFRLRVGDDFE